MDKTYRKNPVTDEKPAKQSVKRTIQSEGSVLNKKGKLNDTGLHKRSMSIFKPEVKRNQTFANDRLKRLRDQILSEVIPISTTIGSTRNSSSICKQRKFIVPSRTENKIRNASSLEGHSTSQSGNKSFLESKKLHIPSYNTCEDQPHYNLIRKSPLKNQQFNISSYNISDNQTHESFFEDDKLTESCSKHSSQLEDRLELKVQATMLEDANTVFSSFVDDNSKLLSTKIPIKVLDVVGEGNSIYSSEKNSVNFEKKEEVSLNNNQEKRTEITVETRQSPSRNVSHMKLYDRTVGSQNGTLNISITNTCIGTENSEIKIPCFSNNLEKEKTFSKYSTNDRSNFEYTTEPISPQKLYDNWQMSKGSANCRLLKLRSNIHDKGMPKRKLVSDSIDQNFVSCISKNNCSRKTASKFGKMTSYVQEKLKSNHFATAQINNESNMREVPITRPSHKSTSNLSNDNITDSVTDETINCDKIANKSHSPLMYKNMNTFRDSLKYLINYGQIIDSVYERFFGPKKKECVISSYNNLSEASSDPSQVDQLRLADNEDAIMDWDDDNDIAELSNPYRCEQNCLKQELYIAVDTNVFLSDLDILKEIVTCGSSGRTKAILYVPWMVLTELDFMKDDKSTAPHSRKKVSDAVAFINKTLLEGGRKLIGQNIFEAEQQKCIGKAPDDKIVSCCLQAKHSNLDVMLLSNDINLKNKLLIHDIPALSSKEMFKNPLFSSSHNFAIENEIHDKLQKINEKMSNCCSYIICECAKYAYGKVWNKMDMLQNPPWTLDVCLQIFKKYWSSVFRERLMKHCLKTVEKLTVNLKGLKLSRNTNKFQEFVQDCLSLCIFLKDLEEHEEFIEHIIKDINSITNY